MESDYVAILILVGCTLGPAAAVTIFFVMKQRRRGKFKRQRITKGQTHRDE